MTTLMGARALREALDRHGCRPRRELGQNFVIDPNTIRKIVDVAGIGPADRVLEIGAGAGSLTLGLADVAGTVTAVEFDRRLLPILDEVLAGAINVTVIAGDALKLDLGAIAANRLVGNLPYNIATTVVLKVLEQAPQIDELTVMTQREVGERLAAGPGSKAYGLTSVLVRYYGDALIAAPVSRRAFFPVPDVDSVIVRIRRGPLPDVDRAQLFKVVRAAFGQRRKTIRRALSSASLTAEDAAAALETAGLAPSARAEEVDLAGFVALTNALS